MKKLDLAALKSVSGGCAPACAPAPTCAPAPACPPAPCAKQGCAS